MLGSQVDRLVVISLRDNTTIGIYMVAFTVASAGLGLISQTFHVVLFPNISHQSSLPAQRELLAKGLCSAMLLLVCLTLALMVLVPWLIPLLFGTVFKAATWPCMVLLLGYVPLALRQVIVRCLRGLGAGVPGTIAEALALVVFLSCSWPFGQQFGLIGIGLAFLVANTVALVYLAGYLRNCLGLALRDWWGLNMTTITQVVHRGYTLLGQCVAAGR
jgi:O-antigen/teichoic acid export membrane protein